MGRTYPPERASHAHPNESPAGGDPMTQSTPPRDALRLTRWNPLRAPWRARLAGASIAVLGVIGMSAVAVPSWAAEASDFASWDDVIAAQNDVDRQQALIDEINGQIAELDTKLQDATGRANAAGSEYGAAAQKLTIKQAEVTRLQEEADNARATAEETRDQAGQLAAAMANRGGGDPSLTLFMNPQRADDLLSQLGMLSGLAEQTDGIYAEAVDQQETAEQLAAQATTAAEELADIEADARTKYDAAMAEQVAAQNDRDAATSQRAELQAMLIPLQEKRNVTQLSLIHI